MWWFALPRSSAGAIKMRRRHRWSVSVRSTDDASHRSYPALQATKRGLSRGNLPLDPVLLPFAGAKGRPRRRAVQTVTPPVTPRRRQATTNFPQKFFCRLLSKEKPPTPAGGEESKIPCMAQATQGIFKGEVMKKAMKKVRKKSMLKKEGCGRWQILRRWRG